MRNAKEKAHAHFASASPDGKYVYVADLGSDKIMNYVVDVKTGKLYSKPGSTFLYGETGIWSKALCYAAQSEVVFPIKRTGKQRSRLVRLTNKVLSLSWPLTRLYPQDIKRKH